MEQGKIVDKKIDSYSTFLHEKYRPPSKGGNKNALHSHVLTISREQYSFLALGTKQWAYKSDTVSFTYVVKGKFKNIIKNTLITVDRNGKSVIRGNRSFKIKLRTAETRMPVSRREMRD